MNEDEVRFHKYLNLLARLSRYELDEPTIEYYDKVLSRYTYKKVCLALDKITRNRNSRDPFPSVKEIESILNPQLDPETISDLVVQNILTYFKDKGPHVEGDLKEKVGEYGLTLIGRMGGYSSLYSGWGRMPMANVGIFRAQLKKVMISLLKLEEAGQNFKQLGIETNRTELGKLGDILKELGHASKTGTQRRIDS